MIINYLTKTIKENKLKNGLINAADSIMDRTIELKGKKSEIGSEDIVIISLQNSILNKVREIDFLIKANKVQSINVILRSMLEQYVYLMYILDSQTYLKAKLFIRSYQIQTYEKLLNTINFMKSDKSFNVNESETVLQKELEKIRKTHPEINNIKDYISYLKKQFDEMSPNKSTKDRLKYEKWYKIDTKTSNMRDLMKSIDMSDAEYEFMYGLASMDVHGISAFRAVNAKKDELILETPINIEFVEALMTSYLFYSSRKIIKYYSVQKDSKIKSYLKQFEINFKLQSFNR